MNCVAPWACLLAFSVLVATDSFSEAILEMHTQMRSVVKPEASNMKMMSYSEPLANLAKKWAERCIFDHPNDAHQDYNGLGQNIAWQNGVNPKISIRRMVEEWFNEWKYYDYETDTSTNVTGHYTQMVWANTNKIGCAKIDCPDLLFHERFMGLPGEFLVCQYSPQGNFAHQWPYKAGKSCSACNAGDACVRNQCVPRSGVGGVATTRQPQRPKTSRPTRPPIMTSRKPSSVKISTSTTRRPWGSETKGWRSKYPQFLSDYGFGRNVLWNRPDKRTSWSEDSLA